MHENHPVINLLRINKGMVGVDVDLQDKMDCQWVKVTNSLFDASCDAIQNRILTKIKTHDLNDMTVSVNPFVSGLSLSLSLPLLSLSPSLSRPRSLRPPDRSPRAATKNKNRSSFTASVAWSGRTSMARTH